MLGGRKAIPVLLELFQARGIRATSATVGALLCESKDELLARATYAASKGAEIARLEDIGSDKQHDAYYFGASLARLIAACPGQEIGTHVSRIVARSSRVRPWRAFPRTSRAPWRSSGSGASNANRSSFPAINTAPNILRLAARLD